MDKFERRFRLVCEFLIYIIIFYILSEFLIFSYAIFLSFIFAHTLMWIINGQIFALLRIKQNSINKLIDYINHFQKKIQNKSFLDGVAVFGGLSVKRYHEYSDVDIRLIRSQGIWNGIRACCYSSIERAKALFMAFPLDIYVFDSFEELNKESQEQITPVILLDTDEKLKIQYPKGMDFISFKKGILKDKKGK